MWKLLFPKRPTETFCRHGRDGQTQRQTVGKTEKKNYIMRV